MRSAHMAAFLDRLEGVPVPVHDSEPPLADGTVVKASYVVAWDLGPDVLDDERLTAEQRVDSDGVYRWVTKSVGTTPFAARAVRDAVAAQMTGHRLVIAGRTCGPIELDPGNAAVQTDRSVTPPLYFIEDDWVASSSRA